MTFKFIFFHIILIGIFIAMGIFASKHFLYEKELLTKQYIQETISKGEWIQLKIAQSTINNQQECITVYQKFLEKKTFSNSSDFFIFNQHNQIIYPLTEISPQQSKPYSTSYLNQYEEVEKLEIQLKYHKALKVLQNLLKKHKNKEKFISSSL